LKAEGKTLKSLLYAGAFAAAAIFLPGCEPEEPEPLPPDTTLPSITISSPLENKVYESSTISYEGAIQEAHFKSAWYSTDNEQTKNPITEKTWSKQLDFSNGNHNLITYADDSAGNFSRKTIPFSVNRIIQLFIDPFVSPDANGAAYNALTTKAARDAYIQTKLYEDWVNTIPYSINPLWVCGHYAFQLMTNSRYWGEEIKINNGVYYQDRLYNWYKGRNVDSIKFNQGTLIDMGKLGLPMGFLGLVDTSHYNKKSDYPMYWIWKEKGLIDSKGYFGHGMNWVLTGDNIKWEDLNILEPQTDQINVKPGGWNIPKDCDEVTISYYYSTRDEIKGNYLKYVHLAKFRIEDGNPILIWENTDPKYSIKKQRGK
jgi:hypothetical protein